MSMSFSIFKYCHVSHSLALSPVSLWSLNCSSSHESFCNFFIIFYIQQYLTWLNCRRRIALSCSYAINHLKVLMSSVYISKKQITLADFGSASSCVRITECKSLWSVWSKQYSLKVSSARFLWLTPASGWLKILISSALRLPYHPFSTSSVGDIPRYAYLHSFATYSTLYITTVYGLVHLFILSLAHVMHFII